MNNHGPRTPTPNLNTVLAERLWRVGDDTRRYVDGLLDCDYEISHAQVVVLRALVERRCDGKLADIAKHLGCTSENAGRLVARLVGRDYLRRAAGGDARMKAVVATAKGIENLSYLEQHIMRDVGNALQPLDYIEKEQLLALLSRIHDYARTTRSSEESA